MPFLLPNRVEALMAKTRNNAYWKIKHYFQVNHALPLSVFQRLSSVLIYICLKQIVSYTLLYCCHYISVQMLHFLLHKFDYQHRKIPVYGMKLSVDTYMVLNNCIMQGLLKTSFLRLWLFSHWAVNERTALHCQLEQNSPVIFDKEQNMPSTVTWILAPAHIHLSITDLVNPVWLSETFSLQMHAETDQVTFTSSLQI